MSNDDHGQFTDRGRQCDSLPNRHQGDTEMKVPSGRLETVRTSETSTALRRGAAAVEMALVTPLFLMMVFGIIEFGRGMMVSNLLVNTAREGTRAAVLNGSTNSSVTMTVQTFMNTTV